MWENAYSSLKSVERPINLCTILFDNHSPFKNHFFCYSKYILGDVLDKYVQRFEEKYIYIFSAKKNAFCPRMHIFIFTFQVCYLASSLWLHLQFKTHSIYIF